METRTGHKIHHVECCPTNVATQGKEYCAECSKTLQIGPASKRAFQRAYEELLVENLKRRPCSVCGKTSYYKYEGPTYTA